MERRVAEEVTLEPSDKVSEELKKVMASSIKGDGRTFLLGTTLKEEEEEALIQLLRENIDVFAWDSSDMTGISPDIICHQLHINPVSKPIKQKQRRISAQQAQVLEEEVQKLLQAGVIKEVQFPDWIANTVIVKKKNGKWRVCVDFTDLNKACPKDCFPMPKIDQLIDTTAGHELMSFLDAYSGYHQIPLHESDQVKTAFITPLGLYCYKMMPFGLKNAGATYQRLVTKMFHDQIGRTMEVYIDDMLVKSKKRGDHLQDLKTTFSIIRKNGMKLNAMKCSFGVSSGKFLGYMVSQRGIEANPDQISAIQNLRSPRTIKEVQRLTGMVAALNRFIAKSSDKCRPLFQALKKKTTEVWDDECDKSLTELKRYLTTPPILSVPVIGELLFIYLAVSDFSISAVLVREEGREQKPVFYVSKMLLDAERRYMLMEKAALALITSSRKLRPYFQAHPIAVLTSFPLRAVLRKADLSGRVVKWAVELGEFDISYRPRTAIKGQVLADFLAEFSVESTGDLQFRQLPQSQDEAGASSESELWKMYVDQE